MVTALYFPIICVFFITIFNVILIDIIKFVLEHMDGSNWLLEEQLNTIYIFENDQIFFGYEIMDFEKTIQNGTFQVRKPYIISQHHDQKHFKNVHHHIYTRNEIKWLSDFKASLLNTEKSISLRDAITPEMQESDNLDKELKIVCDVIPSKPLTNTQLKQLIDIINEAYDYDVKLKEEQEHQQLVQRYQKANYTKTHRDTSNTGIKDMRNYVTKLQQDEDYFKEKIETYHQQMQTILTKEESD